MPSIMDKHLDVNGKYKDLNELILPVKQIENLIEELTKFCGDNFELLHITGKYNI